LEQAVVSDSLLESFDRTQGMAFNADSTDEEMRKIMNANLAEMTAVLRSAIDQLNWQLEDGEPSEKTIGLPRPGVSVFISHSSKDATLAEALIDLLRSALGLPANEIRCSSVDGYRLPVGVNTESKLREEVNAAKVVIGLVTPSSLASSYVMFELGARWGASLFLAPLLAGVTPNELSGPLALLNVLSADNESQLHQLLEDVSTKLGVQLPNAASYVRHLSAVKQLAMRQPAAPSVPASQVEKPGQAQSNLGRL